MFLLTSPNHQLLVHFLMLLVACIIIIVALAVVYRKQVQLGDQFGKVIPLWRHVLGEVSAMMRHDKPWAVEQDVLMDEALNWEVQMTAERKERLLELVAVREIDPNPELRKGEHRAAKIYPILLDLAYSEAVSPEGFAGARMVGSRALEKQSIGDARKQEVAH